ncbi:MAG: PKD domain-containing protein, partial [Methanoregula sp.]|nr:PKD domain-containing protein [Methanoregula sp.]
MKLKHLIWQITFLLVIFAVVPSPVLGADDPGPEYSYSFVHLSDIQTLTTAYPSTLNLAFSEIEDLKSEYNISAIFITGDLTNEYDGGPGNGVDFARYAEAVALTTIPVYEIAGNHDVNGIGGYAAWDMYVPSGSTKHNYGLVFNDFIVYGFGWSGENSLDPAARTEMQIYQAGDTTKTPLILTHAYMWPSGGRDPVAYDLLDALTRNSIVLSGHRHNAVQNGLIRQTVYNDITVIEDMINYQDWGRYSGGRLYTITSDGSHITEIKGSDLYLYPDLGVNNTRSYDLSSEDPPGTAAIHVISPDGGESWAGGSIHAVYWTTSGDVESVTIKLLKGDSIARTILSDTNNDGSYGSWTIPPELEPGSDYRIRITSTDDSAITDMSNTYFSITSGTPASSIAVTSPDGGESWAGGSSYAITWTSSGDAGSFVNIELLNGETAVQSISSTTENDGSYSSWTIPPELGPGSGYRIRITSATNPVITDTSNNNFSITSGTPASSITVTAPDGGESLVADSTSRITWSSSGEVGSVNIGLLKGNTVVQTIVSDTENDGSYSSWTISPLLTPGSDYRIRIASTTDPMIADTSNNYFTITSGSSTSSITVTSTPSGAHIFIDGADTSQVTPDTVTSIPVGEHIVHVTKVGYVTPTTRVIPVVGGQTVTADFTLVPGPMPVVNFTGIPLNGTAPLTVAFTDLSTNGPDAWNWTFGDGDTTNATMQNPVHTYTSAGLYTVSLNATNVNGFNSTTKIRCINVTGFAPGATSRIGVFRPSSHSFYLDANGNGAWNGAGIDRTNNFGLAGDIPVSGDWNHDGITDIGVFRPST